MPAPRKVQDAEQNGMLRVSGIASYLDVSEQTVARLCVKGELPAHKVGRQWRIRRSDFLNWLRKGKTGKWRQFTSVAEPIGSASSGAGRKSESPLEQLLKAKPENISTAYSSNTGS